MATKAPDAATSGFSDEDRKVLHDSLDALLNAEDAREATAGELMVRLQTARAEMRSFIAAADEAIARSECVLAAASAQPASNPLTDLVGSVAQATGLSPEDANKAVGAVFQSIDKVLINSARMRVYNSNNDMFVGHNLRTGEPVIIRNVGRKNVKATSKSRSKAGSWGL